VQVDPDLEKVNVTGIPDALFEYKRLKILLWECKNLSFVIFGGSEFRQLSFAILDAIKVYEKENRRYPTELCGILSSGRVFVLIQALQVVGDTYQWRTVDRK
jgi:hypothetical protein